MSRLVILHGMGQHTADSFKHEVIAGLTWALNLYDDITNKLPEHYIDIVSVEYNHYFDQVRKNMANQLTPIQGRLSAIPNMSPEWVTEALNAIVGFQSQLGVDNFFNTHWLDVFLYRFTTVGEMVRIHVGNAIADEISTVYGGAPQVHVLAHSLGTSVAHDTLAKLYGNGPYTLDVGAHKFGSLHMIANTSHVLESFIAVDQSTVKPGQGGCCEYYREYRHLLDPITWPLPFNPSKGSSWISDEYFDWQYYSLLRLQDITNAQGNTHNVVHYLANPLVHQQIFERVFKISLTKEQREQGIARYNSYTLGHVIQELSTSLSTLNNMNIDSISGLIECAKTAKSFVENLGGQYEF